LLTGNVLPCDAKMTDVWLPIVKRRFPNPQSEREELMNRLYELSCMVPDGMEMPIDQLRGIVAWQEENAKKTRLKPKPDPAKLIAARKDLKQALREIKQHRDALKEGRRRLY